MHATGFHFRLVALISVVVTLAACPLFLDDSSSGSNNPIGPAGSLEISVSGLPEDSLRPGIAVRLSSSGETVEISSSDLTGGLSDSVRAGIAPGTYTVTVFPVRNAHEIVDTVYDPVNVPAEVIIIDEEQQELTLEFAPRPGTGSLWVSSAAESRLVRYDASELTGSGAPAATFNFSHGSPNDLVFRSDGSMWLVHYIAPGELNIFHPAQWEGLNADDDLPDPALTVLDAALGGSTSIAIDDDDNVFVTQYNWGDLIRFDGLAATEPDPTNPVVVEISPDGIFDTPDDIFFFNSARFDPAGNLWIGTFNGKEFYPDDTRTLLRFTPGDLYLTGTHPIEPSLTGDFDKPLSVEFDADGRMWVTVNGTVDDEEPPKARLLRFDDPNGLSDGFTAADADLALEVLAAPGDPIVPVSIAFDNSGYLWTYDYDHSVGGSGRMVRIDVASVPDGATSVTAASVFTGTPPSDAGGWWGTFLAFNPPPPEQ